MAYRVTIGDQSWMTDELTLDEACAIEEKTGTTWRSMEPVYSAALARAMFVTLLARSGDEGKAREQVGAMTVDEALSCISLPDGVAIYDVSTPTYRISIDGHTWVTEELTLDEACTVEEATGSSWLALQPVNSAKHARSILTLFLARQYGLVAAKMRVDKMSIADTHACITKLEPTSGAKAAAEAPKAPAEPTTSESPSPSPTETSPDA